MFKLDLDEQRSNGTNPSVPTTNVLHSTPTTILSSSLLKIDTNDELLYRDLNLNTHHHQNHLPLDDDDDDDDDDMDDMPHTNHQRTNDLSTNFQTKTQSTSSFRDREIHNRLEKHRYVATPFHRDRTTKIFSSKIEIERVSPLYWSNLSARVRCFRSFFSLSPDGFSKRSEKVFSKLRIKFIDFYHRFRRAHLKDCFDSLKAEVPCQRDRKITNLQVLNLAIKYIQVNRHLSFSFLR